MTHLTIDSGFNGSSLAGPQFLLFPVRAEATSPLEHSHVCETLFVSRAYETQDLDSRRVAWAFVHSLQLPISSREVGPLALPYNLSILHQLWEIFDDNKGRGWPSVWRQTHELMHRWEQAVLRSM